MIVYINVHKYPCRDRSAVATGGCWTRVRVTDRDARWRELHARSVLSVQPFLRAELRSDRLRKIGVPHIKSGINLCKCTVHYSSASVAQSNLCGNSIRRLLGFIGKDKVRSCR
jgi:hypothetical protein